MQGSLCVSFMHILFAGLALMEVLAVASPRNHSLASAAAASAVEEKTPQSSRYKQRFSYQDFLSEDRRNHHQEDAIAGAQSSKPSAQRSRDVHPFTSRHQLQQTSTRLSTEVQVLMAFKEGITSDPLGALNDWNSNDSNFCHWKGMTCTERSNSIMAIELGNLQLVGTISPLLGRLTNLQTLDLSDNSFDGVIPKTLLNCSRLSFLGLRNNNLTGEIPSQMGVLLHLQVLDLGLNLLLAGPIPASLSNCSMLGLIHLDYTRVSGEIPSSLGLLARLESLNLTNTFNSGTIPKSLGNCTYLTVLEMGNAYNVGYSTSNSNDAKEELGGELPAELSKLKRLKSLGLFGSSVQGAFPAWIANLTEMTTLTLSFNSLSGEIPAFLGKLPLESLTLGGGSFSGAIPAAISNCSNLWSLQIEATPNVTGSIPPELGMLSKLETLFLDQNSLTGTIPSSLSNCSALRLLALGANPLLDPQPVPSWVASLVNLTYLFLGDMNLQGEIPIALGELSKLDHLYLWINNLTGPVPASLGNCTRLISLQLSENDLRGEIPSEIWMLSQLKNFVMSGNALTGTLPASIGNLSFLQSFACDRNFFSGDIPSQLGNLQSLEGAIFDSNNFDGSTIPQSLGNCSALNLLSMSGDNLSGSIPGSLGNLTELGLLYLSENQLEGGIPVDFMRSPVLEYLDLSYNLLVGSVPQEIGQLISLRFLYLNDNKLSGNLPNSLGVLSGLSYLDVSYNKFYGPVPGEAIANMSSFLISLNVSHNLLSGSLPTELGKLTLVSSLEFSVNNFSGSIPLALGDCKLLTRLDLSINNLSGGIPPTLAQLQYLGFVNMSYNQLQGPIPEGGVFNSSNLTATSFLGNPGLCGSVLKGCPAGPSPESASSCKAFRCGRKRTVIILACAGAGIVLVAVVVICWLFYYEGTNDDAISALLTFDTGLKVSEEELLSIIERPENMIGVGATSTVYKGVLNGGRTVAIKVLSLLNDSDDFENNHPQAAAQLYIEAHTLAELRHRNILKVYGLFSTQSIKALILEFMPKASLHQQLYAVEECELGWEARLNIALGVAQGIVYLHSQAYAPVIHRDLKPSNIFLDADLEPKLGDFGISRTVNPDRSGDGDVTASKLCGTFGYIPPEYAATTRVSTKGDVYSYGVILLELLTRKPPTVAVPDFGQSDLGLRGQASRHLVDWVLESSKETPLAVLDPMLLVSESFLLATLATSITAASK